MTFSRPLINQSACGIYFSHVINATYFKFVGVSVEWSTMWPHFDITTSIFSELCSFFCNCRFVFNDDFGQSVHRLLVWIQIFLWFFLTFLFNSTQSMSLDTGCITLSNWSLCLPVLRRKIQISVSIDKCFSYWTERRSTSNVSAVLLRKWFEGICYQTLILQWLCLYRLFAMA